MAGSGSTTTNHNIRYITIVIICLILIVTSNNLKLRFDVSDYASSGTIPTTGGTIVQQVQVQQVGILNPLGIPEGQAENLPSLRIADPDVEKKRSIYGGKGDGKHLGGFTELDLHGVSPAVWKHMLQVYGIHSVLDVGCGRGTSTSWFALHNCSVMCVEGSHDAIENSIFGTIADADKIVEHDFSRGPWWPGPTFDAVWAVEILEHIGVNYHFNYISTFRKAALLFVTSSRWGGWHHVEVHSDEWWIRKYELYGFKYDEKLTNEIREIAKLEGSLPETDPRSVAPNGGKYNGQHIWLSMKVFVNPVVAALPQHAHLFPEHGCYQPPDANGKKNRICGEGSGSELESKLPQSYWPLEPTVEQDEAWNELIRKHVTMVEKKDA